MLDTVKDACGAAARSPRYAPRSLTASAPGAPMCSWSGRRNGSRSNQETDCRVWCSGASLAHQRPELAGRRWCDRSIQNARHSDTRNGRQCRVIAWSARRGTSWAASIWAPKPHIWAQAIRITYPSNLLQAGGRPHMREAQRCPDLIRASKLGPAVHGPWDCRVAVLLAMTIGL